MDLRGDVQVLANTWTLRSYRYAYATTYSTQISSPYQNNLSNTFLSSPLSHCPIAFSRAVPLHPEISNLPHSPHPQVYHPSTTTTLHDSLCPPRCPSSTTPRPLRCPKGSTKQAVGYPSHPTQKSNLESKL
ncbi:unnamed protein product [Periconia digitata]|uniref:Uncharacterized protein n=1 Tax=Periconia digitata TaxID=1303443 RepID=A0A9W4URS4_9PLEO|nr:unnamed protein product [Periconia digitata]